MGLRIRYEYECDFCGEKAGESEEYHMSLAIGINWQIPHPSKGLFVGKGMVCYDCFKHANDGLKLKFAKQHENAKETGE